MSVMRMSSNVIQGHFRTRLDIDPDLVLQGAVGQVNKVLVIGSCSDGDGYYAASTGNKSELLLMIEQFKFKLLNGDLD
jgi:hypothetical protein